MKITAEDFILNLLNLSRYVNALLGHFWKFLLKAAKVNPWQVPRNSLNWFILEICLFDEFILAEELQEICKILTKLVDESFYIIKKNLHGKLALSGQLSVILW